MEDSPFSVSEAIAYVNQTLEYAYPSITIEGEVSGFKLNQNKFVFFDIKDESGILNCFMMAFALRVPVEDGMKVRITARPKVTDKGRFSLTVRDIKPVGEGSLKRSFDLLKAKLDKEGLFAPERKRTLPYLPKRVGIISSTSAAGYADFVKIVSQRWGDIELVVAHTQVQGVDAPQQIIRALAHFNEMAEPVEAIAIIRGGGSADDLSAFNDEPLVRAIAASRIPTIVGVGHEVDVSLADLASDVRAATPSNAAQLLVPDKQEIVRQLHSIVRSMTGRISLLYDEQTRVHAELREQLGVKVTTVFERTRDRYSQLAAILSQLDPRNALQRGYALVFDAEHKPIGSRAIKPGQTIQVETKRYTITAGVHDATEKHS